jgi:spermidine synthase
MPCSSRVEARLDVPKELSLPAPREVATITWRRHGVMWLMLASGFAGLGYQMVWTQQCALWLGHESAAVLAVVSAFFGGLALGALWMGPRIERSQQPARWYVACELAIAAWGLVLMALMPAFSVWAQGWIGAQPSPTWQWAVSFVGTFLLLLPATLAMGATLPAIERAVGGAMPKRSIAGLYAANTLGAVLGVLISTFVLVPSVGLGKTVWVCVALNVLCAALAWRLFHGQPVHAKTPSVHGHVAAGGRIVLWQLALTGLLGIGYELMVVRVISQVAEDTVYTFAMLLTVYLVGTSLGAALYQRWQARTAELDAHRVSAQLAGALALACLLGTASLWPSEHVMQAVHEAFGGGVVTAVGAEALLALLAFGLPTCVMGALFSHLSAQAHRAGHSFGLALGVNTLGAALAAPLFGVLLTPWLGAKAVLLPLAATYLLLALPRAWASIWVWGPAGLAVVMAVVAPALVFVEVPEGGHVVSYREGVMAAVSVVEDAEGVARLRINNRQQEGSTSTRLVDARQALLPMFLHPGPHHALFLGLGTGVTSGSASEAAGLQVDTVELLPEVIDASQHFRRVFDDPSPNPRLNVMAGDARRFVRASAKRYDLIVSDNFQPARSGSGALYTVEHFKAVKQRLAEGGVFCQWLPLHQMDLRTLRSIVQSFLQAYPGGVAILASNSLETPVIGLVGRYDDGRFDASALRQHLAQSAMPRPPAAFGLDDEMSVLGSVIAGPSALMRFAGNAPANTDDLPVVAYLAPRTTYAPDDLPRDRLIALLAEVSASPDEVLSPDADADAALPRRLNAYWQARNAFILAGKDVHPSGRVQDMLAQVEGPLLAVLRTSPDFRPAYTPLLGMAAALANEDPAAAQALLAQLQQAHPHRPEAAQMLAEFR